MKTGMGCVTVNSRGQRAQAFTLVELLVVVTIIVVLLAMLTPAIDRAIYQAEMAVCAGDQHGLGVAVIVYSQEYRKNYPYRPSVHDWPQWPGNLQRGVPRTDDRPMLRPYMNINATFNCPLIPFIDIEAADPIAYAFSTYNLWFGFQYHRAGGSGQNGPLEKGMLRVGDRWEFYDPEPDYTLHSSLLAAPRYFQQNNGDIVSASHPGETYAPYVLQNQIVAGFEFVLARWDSVDRTRGPIDLNALFDDASVGRYDRVGWQDDDRTARAAEYSDGSNFSGNHEIVPKR